MHPCSGHEESSVTVPHLSGTMGQLGYVSKPSLLLTPYGVFSTPLLNGMRVFTISLPSSHPDGKENTYPTEDRVDYAVEINPKDQQNANPYSDKIHEKSRTLSTYLSFMCWLILPDTRLEAGWIVKHQQLDA